MRPGTQREYSSVHSLNNTVRGPEWAAKSRFGRACAATARETADIGFGAPFGGKMQRGTVARPVSAGLI